MKYAKNRNNFGQFRIYFWTHQMIFDKNPMDLLQKSNEFSSKIEQICQKSNEFVLISNRFIEKSNEFV